MTKPIARYPIYRKRVFDADIIELCVRWYISYRLSYRDLLEMMAERGIAVVSSANTQRRDGWCQEILMVETTLGFSRNCVQRSSASRSKSKGGVRPVKSPIAFAS